MSPIRKMRQTGMVKSREPSIPAVTAALSPLGSFEALLLEMSLETVMGIPPVPRVMKTEKTDRATW